MCVGVCECVKQLTGGAVSLSSSCVMMEFFLIFMIVSPESYAPHWGARESWKERFRSIEEFGHPQSNSLKPS